MKKFKIVAYKPDGSASEIFPEAADMNARLTMLEQSGLYEKLEVYLWFLDKWLFMFKSEV